MLKKVMNMNLLALQPFIRLDLLCRLNQINFVQWVDWFKLDTVALWVADPPPANSTIDLGAPLDIPVINRPGVAGAVL